MKVLSTIVAAALGLAPVSVALAGDKAEHGAKTEHGATAEHGSTTTATEGSSTQQGATATGSASSDTAGSAAEAGATQTSPPSMADDKEKQFDPKRQPPQAPATEGSKTSTSPQGGPEKTPNPGDTGSEKKY